MSNFQIGELAAFAGVTARTIRHYHDIGLLPEPERSPTGVRRYRAGDAVRLTRIRRLVDSGFTLSEIVQLYPAEAEEISEADFTRAKTLVTHRLRNERLAIAQHEANLASLTRPADIDLPETIAGLLETWKRCGMRDTVCEITRTTWSIAYAIAPQECMDLLTVLIREDDEQGQYRYLIAEASHLWDAPPGDARLDDIAEKLATAQMDILRRYGVHLIDDGFRFSPGLEHAAESLYSPGWRYLAEKIERHHHRLTDENKKGQQS
ncbi:MerR family transcriptional regulator [Corynebacterium mendelii]|uniref:MerR family DNA-binding transcriptional regulator n=1 Tax=Corynebacterium mendelii TaxID=2765362 RepID=A0A939IUL1_9CORY|nr:MerR family transcriptional regulator [Corynebacterium mendelii]MBN9645049.1 MerR family DNA-binding transcriptional regulator [Corynebacterium mendelii]